MKHTEITNIVQLAQFLNIDHSYLSDFINNGWEVPVNEETKISNTLPHAITVSISALHRRKFALNEMKLKKKGRINLLGIEYRTVFEVRDPMLNNGLKSVYYHLRQLYHPQNSVHGYVRHRSIKTNAKRHLGKKVVLRFDIKDFFGAINEKKVNETFINLGFQDKISDILTKLTTHERKLAQGFCTSPLLANIFCANMDYDFEKLSDSMNCSYTRYSDDCYFSSNETLPSQIEIDKILSDYGFSLNLTKWKIMKKGGNQYVTGLTVVDKINPRIPRRIKNQIRYNYFFYSQSFTKPEYFDYLMHPKHLEGWLKYINSIEPWFVQNLKYKYGDLFD